MLSRRQVELVNAVLRWGTTLIIKSRSLVIQLGRSTLRMVSICAGAVTRRNIGSPEPALAPRQLTRRPAHEAFPALPSQLALELNHPLPAARG